MEEHRARVAPASKGRAHRRRRSGPWLALAAAGVLLTIIAIGISVDAPGPGFLDDMRIGKGRPAASGSDRTARARDIHEARECALSAAADKVPEADVLGFLTDIDERLPRYRESFIAAAREHDLPWRLLAAQAYAESRWDPEARSPTGVLGMMQLSKAAASEVGVSQRLDADESIAGGARYLAGLVRKIPEDVQVTSDRVALALVAYNIGFAHVQDARRVASAMGVSPNDWQAVRRAVGLLGHDPAFDAVRKRRGRVSGRAAVAYVDRIHRYRRVLRDCL